MLRYIAIVLLLVAWTAETVQAEGPSLAFQPAEKGYYTFDTGLFRGKMRVDGEAQGLCSIVHVPTGTELVASPGLLSYYRVFSTGIRYGKAVRDWPVVARVVQDGALEIRFPPAADHPMEVTGTFRWLSPDTLDLITTVKAADALPRLEVFLSSYFVEGFDAFVYMNRNRYGEGPPAALLRADRSELLDGNYLIFPRDDKALQVIYDGRWNIPPDPVTFAFVRYLAAPIAVRRNEKAGLTAVLMSLPDECFAVAASYNKQPPDNVAAHRSLYLSLFGRDLAAGQVAQSRCRLTFGNDLSDDAILERYRQYVAATLPKP